MNFGDTKKNNLSKSERTALKDLMSNPEIIIKSTDKGGSLVIHNKDDYLEEAYRILSDSQYYNKINTEPSAIYSAEYHTWINTAYENAVLNKKQKKYLTIMEPKMTIYLLSA